MQIQLFTDSHIDARESMQERLDSVVMEVLGQFGNRITRVQAHLTGAHDTTPARPHEVDCSLEAQPIAGAPVVAKHRADTASQAIHGALRKIGCMLASEFARQDHQCACPVQRGTVVAEASA